MTDSGIKNNTIMKSLTKYLDKQKAIEADAGQEYYICFGHLLQ
jgi:hypothetical protein